MYRALMVVSLFLVAGNALADPIRISGISWAEDRTSQIAGLKSAGYACESEIFADLSTFSQRDSVKCAKDKNEVRFFDDEIVFSCNVFNMCGLSIGEVAQSLVDAGKVPRMEIEFKWPNKSLSSWREGCGRGSDGDRLCIGPDREAIVMGFPVGDEFAKLRLLKGTYGNKPSFD